MVGAFELWFPGLLVGVELWFPVVGTMLWFPVVGTVLGFVGVGLSVTVTEETVVVGVGLMLLEEAVGIIVGFDVTSGLGVALVVLGVVGFFFPCTAKINN